tara:strand:- start:242 stop:601 length:360 start_codon:yes stop_codon:yes gene_type:complete
MNDKQYGPKITGKAWTNDHKESKKQPDYRTSNSEKFHIKADEAWLKSLVDALRGQGTYPRIGMAVWVNEQEDGKRSLYFELEAITVNPEDSKEEARGEGFASLEAAPEPAPKNFDDIPF